jgi:hypothetical protein
VESGKWKVESGKWTVESGTTLAKTRKALNVPVMPAQAGIHAAEIEGADWIRGYGIYRVDYYYRNPWNAELNLWDRWAPSAECGCS